MASSSCSIFRISSTHLLVFVMIIIIYCCTFHTVSHARVLLDDDHGSVFPNSNINVDDYQKKTPQVLALPAATTKDELEAEYHSPYIKKAEARITVPLRFHLPRALVLNFLPKGTKRPPSGPSKRHS